VLINFKERIREYVNAQKERASKYQLTLITGLALFILLGLSIGVLVTFTAVSIKKVTTMRSELFDRDLRELTNRFDLDERFVLEKNIQKLVSAHRELTPLLLPRQYFTSLPSSPQSLASPRQPPRNCFVTLLPSGTSANEKKSATDKICAYFVENKALGKYLFLSGEFVDNTVVTLRPGDLTFSADAIKVSIIKNEKRVDWWLTLQSPPGQANKGRYEITAFRENANHTRERDKRIDGWAYTQRQVDGNQVISLIARIDFKEFVDDQSSEEDTALWPPTGWSTVGLEIGRKSATVDSKNFEITQYKQIGISNLSIVSLAAPIFNAHATLQVKRAAPNGKTSVWPVYSDEPGVLKAPAPFITIVDGDLLLKTTELERVQKLADTTLSFKVIHPGTVIEKGLWEVFILLLLLAMGAGFAVYYFFTRLLKPIFVLTRQSRQLIDFPEDGNAALPYAHQKDEIGTLSKRFNELLRKTHERATKEHLARTEREAEASRRQMEEVKNREENLNIIGHEIRSPLQALMGLHAPGTDSRRYIDRISSALPHLQRGVGAEDALSARQLSPEILNITNFLAQVATNAELAQIPNVSFFNNDDNVHCEVDPEAIEDAISNVLSNANRHRYDGSRILIDLTVEGKTASIKISNAGESIDLPDVDIIFEYGFSTVTASRVDGTGIGLWVARKYINRMQGSISVSNIEGGVCFEIRLPIVDQIDYK